MKDLGAIKQILGMRIIRDMKNNMLKLSQEDYVKKILQRFSMANAKLVSTPLARHYKLSKDLCQRIQDEKEYMARVPYASTLRSLMYEMICTRPNIDQAVGVVSKFMNNPRKRHWQAIKWIFKYIRGTSKFCLNFDGTNVKLQGFVDSDMVGDIDGGRSITSDIFIVGGGVMSWISKFQLVVALSIMKDEYIAMIEASKEIIWLQMLL